MCVILLGCIQIWHFYRTSFRGLLFLRTQCRTLFCVNIKGVTNFQKQSGFLAHPVQSVFLIHTVRLIRRAFKTIFWGKWLPERAKYCFNSFRSYYKTKSERNSIREQVWQLIHLPSFPVMIQHIFSTALKRL